MSPDTTQCTSPVPEDYRHRCNLKSVHFSSSAGALLEVTGVIGNVR
jgi:hypothetical protein